MKKIISFVTIMMVLFVTTSVVQASSFTLTATPNDTEVNAGETVTISLQVGDIQLGDNGMNTLEGKIAFDSNIFEVLTEESAIGQNNWTASINAETDNTKYGTFFFNKNASGIKTETMIGSITLQVKNTIQEDTPTVITITNIQSNDGTDLVTVEDKVIPINVKAVSTTPDQEPEVNEVPEINITTNEITEPEVNETPTPSGTVNKADDTVKDNTLPQTGENFLIGASIIAVGAIAIYFYIRAYKVK